MERWLCTRRTAHGDPVEIRSRLTSEIGPLLQQAADSPVTSPSGDGSFMMTLHTRGSRLSKVVEVHVGAVEPLSSGVQIPISWHARGITSALIPSFKGWVELEEAARDGVTIAVVGSYRPPVSLVGAVADAAALSTLAERTIEDLTVRLADLLSTSASPVAVASARNRLTVGDVMTPDPLTLTSDTSLRTAANLLLLGRISGIPVVDERGRLDGVLSERDLLDKVAPLRTGLTRSVNDSWRHHDAITVGEACSRPVRTTSVDASLRDAAGVMARHDVGRLVVLQGAEIAGIITRRDVLKALVRADEVIEDDVRALVREHGQPNVVALVEHGVVRLAGTVDLRSSLGTILGLVGEMDGVIAVSADELTWEVDDVVIVPPLV